MAKVKKYLPGAESLGTSFGDKAGAFMGNYGGAITQAAGTLMPLLMKKPDPNSKPYKKGSKLIKYQEGNSGVYIKNDSIKYKTSQGDVASGATFEEMPKPGAKNTNTAPVTTTKTSPKEESKFQALGEGGWGREKEAAAVGVMSAIGEMFPEKSKLGGIGKVLKNTLKYGPTAVRSVYDLVFEASQKGVDNINWKERLGNFLQDASAATTSSGLVRFGKNTGKNIKEQVNKAASKNPEKDVIEPISFKKAASKGAMEAAEKSTILSFPANAVKFGEKTKVALQNISSSQKRNKAAQELEAANTAATNLALQKKHTGPANTKKGVGVEGTFYVKGSPVSKEQYDSHIASAIPERTSKQLESIDKQLKNLIGTGANKRNVSDLTPEELIKYKKLQNKKKPLITYQKQETIRKEKEAQEAARKEAEEAANNALAEKAAAKKAALQKAREVKAQNKANKEAAAKAAEKKNNSGGKINFKGQGKKGNSNSSSGKTSNKTSGKASSKKQSSATEDEPTDDAIMGMAAQLGMGRGRKK